MNKDKLVELGKTISKEALGNLPYGGFVVPFVELLMSLIPQDQLTAAIEWVQETKNTTLPIDSKLPNQKKIESALELHFKGAGSETSYAFGYPRSFVENGRLIQFDTDESEDHLLPNENRVYLGFSPREITKTTRILIADKYEWSESQGAMPGDELPILVPSDDATITVLTLESKRLSSPILSHFERNTATIENRSNRNDRNEPTNLQRWETVISTLNSEVPWLLPEQSN